MIDWMNPSDDVIEAKRIGYNEGIAQNADVIQRQDDEIACLTAELAACSRDHQAMEAMRMLGVYAVPGRAFDGRRWWARMPDGYDVPAMYMSDRISFTDPADAILKAAEAVGGEG